MYVCKTQPSVLIFREVLTSAKRVALKVTVPSGCSGTFMATSLCENKRRRELSTRVPSITSSASNVDSLYRPHGEGTAFQSREAAESFAA